ncbi:MAG TPA: DUF4124 domain-containing protein [Thermodesulfobacteriota bacterium]|nr:DUF4124 domain-containing protein [Thermodesulfobacteriota bacterium]
MGRITFFVAITVVVISFLSLKVAHTQTMGEGTGVNPQGSQELPQGAETQPQAPNVIQDQPNYPYIDNSGRVYPYEDLNPFGLSTLGPGDDEYNTEGSTLGTDIKRKSNLEVNQPRERKQPEATNEGETVSGGEETAVEGGEEAVEVIPEESSEVLTPSPLGKTSGFYKWVDKDGVLHVTDNPGSIPQEYQGQLTNEPTK